MRWWHPEPCNECKNNSEAECSVWLGTVYDSIIYCRGEHFEEFDFRINVDRAVLAETEDGE